MGTQLALRFDARPARGRGDFVVASCNENAVRFIDRWPDWPTHAAALHGPAGCGKTHLVEVWMSASGAHCVAASRLSTQVVAELPAGTAVAVEDFDAVPPSGERDEALMALFESASGALLLTGQRPPALWPIAISDLGSRLVSLVAFPMWAPDDALLGQLARKLFADRQLTVPDAVIARILTALERTPAAVAAFVAEADRKALADRRPITERLVLRMLDEMPRE